MLLLGVLTGCFDPQPPTGAPCGPNGECPTPLVCSPSTSTCEVTSSAPVDASTLPTFAEISGRQWLMPCTAPPNPTLCDCVDSTSTVTVGGAPNTVYSVRVRIRGIMERGAYKGGMAVGQNGWYVGGAVEGSFLTVAELRVSEPMQSYYLNALSGMGLRTLDYEATVPIAGGATVTFFMSALDGREVTSATAMIPGVVTNPSPYLGQFAQLDVLQVTTQ